VWQELNDDLSANGIDIVVIGLDVEPTNCYAYMDRAPGLIEAGHSLVDSTHSTVGVLGFKNVPMAMWLNEDGIVVMDAHHSPVTPGWGDRPIPEGLPPRMEGRLVELKKATDRHQQYLAALRTWATTGDVPVATPVHTTHDEALAATAFELGDHFRRAGDTDKSVHFWKMAHRLDPDNWAAKRQAWTLVTTADGAAPDLVQEDTGPYDGNWLDDLVAVGGINRYYPPTPW
jgi:hypothetical protein